MSDPVANTVTTSPAAEAQAADDQHEAHAETVGDRADERLGDAPDHVLQREREGEIGDRQAEIAR